MLFWEGLEFVRMGRGGISAAMELRLDYVYWSLPIGITLTFLNRLAHFSQYLNEGMSGVYTGLEVANNANISVTPWTPVSLDLHGRAHCGYSMGITAMVTLKFLHPGIPLVIVPQRIFGGANNFILLCIPFFMLAGSLMSLTPLFNKLIKCRGCRRPYSRRSLPCEYCREHVFRSASPALPWRDTAAVGSLLLHPRWSRGVHEKLCNGGDSDVVDHRCDYSSQQLDGGCGPGFKYFGASLCFWAASFLASCRD